MNTKKYRKLQKKHTKKLVKVAKKTRKEIITKANRVFKLKERGIKVIFPDVDRIAQKLLDELAKK